MLSEQYTRRKDQITNAGTPKQEIVNVRDEMHKRSSTPTPAARTSVVTVAEAQSKKIIYKTDLESAKVFEVIYLSYD